MVVVSPEIKFTCLAIRDFMALIFIVALAGMATEGLIKGRLRGSRPYLGFTHKKTAPAAFWSGVFFYYAMAILIAVLLIFGLPQWMTKQV